MVQFQDSIFAPLFWGFVASITLGGITIVQAYVYFPAHKDKPFVRWTALTMLLFDLASSALIAYSIYYYLIPEFGSFAPFGTLIPEVTVECLLSTLITMISQLYFVHQLVAVRRMGKGNWTIIVLILAGTIIGAAGGIACVGAMFKFNHAVLSNRNHIFAGMFGIAKGAAAVTDVLATVAMCMFLSDSKSDIPRTNNLLSKLVQFTIQRGALVTLIQALLLITFYAAPSHLAWFAFHMNVTKLYANTFFAMLNARSHLRDTNANGVISGLSGGNISSFNDTHLHSQPRGLSFLQVKTSGSVKESNTHYASFSTGHNGEDGFIAAPSGKVPEVYPQSVMVLGGIIGTPGGLGKGYGRAGGKRSYDAESLDMEMDDMGGKRGAQGGVPGAPVVNVTKTVVVADR